MIYELTRDHLDKKKGDTVSLTDEQLNYYIRVGLVKPVDKDAEIPEVKRGRKKANGES